MNQWHDIANDIIDMRESLGMVMTEEDVDRIMDYCEKAADESGLLPDGWVYEDCHLMD